MQNGGHVFLVGFMCSGKSTVGRLLASLLERPFLDLDRLIEAEVGPLVPFFAREGEAAFRALEARMLREALPGAPAVIATGGGTPCSSGNMDVMRAAGTVVRLDVTMDALMPRVERAGGDRPLLLGLRGAELRERVATLLAAREACYAKAHVAVPADGPPSQVAAEVEAVLRGAQVK